MKDKSVIELFESHAKNTPNAIAVQTEHGTSLTYKELNCWANRASHFMFEMGVKPKDKIVIIMDRTEKLIIMILACLKLDATYVTIDSSNPTERICEYLDDFKDSLIFIEKKEILNFSSPKIILVDNLLNQILKYDDIPIEIERNNPIACVLFTSGSTGKPKGILKIFKNSNIF